MPPPSIEEFEFQERLGKGASGVVYRAVRRKDDRQVAVKQIDVSDMEPEEKEKLVKLMLVEVEALSKMQSPYIIRYFGSFMYDEQMYIVTEYAQNGDLHSYLKAQREPLPENTIWRLLIQAVMGLHHMHSKRILHRDVKSLNIFLDEAYNVKIGDMGISKVMGTMTNFATTLVGTPYYLSPELCEGLSYDEKSDMWALGIVLYELCTCGKKPFDAESLGPLVMQIMDGTYTSIEGYSDELLQIIDGLLTHDMRDRLDTAAMLNSTVIRCKAEEVGIDLTQAARDLSAVEIESHVVRLSLSGSDCSSASKNPGKGAPRIVARGARMSRGCSADEPFESVRPQKAPPSNDPVLRQESCFSQTAATVQTEASIRDWPCDETSGRGGEYTQQTACVPDESIGLTTRMMNTQSVRGDDMDSSLRTEVMDASQRAHSESLAGTRGQTAFANATNPVDAIPAKELPDTARARAVYFAKLAIKHDEGGDFEGAFQLYQECLKYFEMDIKKLDQSKAKVREVLTKKMVAYLERAEYLKQVLETRNMYRAASARGRRRQ